MAKPNLIFVVIDACRADHLSCYGYPKKTSPNLDKLAEDGTLFSSCYSCTTATDSSLTSIFSGRYPVSHGIIDHGPRVAKDEIHALSASGSIFLPEILKQEGYTTIALDWLGRWHRRGYDHYLSDLREKQYRRKTGIARYGKSLVDSMPLKARRLLRRGLRKLKTANKRRYDAEALTGKAFHWVSTSGRPFFLFIHYWDVHAKYDPPKGFVQRAHEPAGAVSIKEIIQTVNNQKRRDYLAYVAGRARTVGEVIDRYDGAISFVDHQIGRLLRVLEAHHILDNTVIVVTSDHGESLDEHGIFFGHHGLYDQTIHVPLIIRYPGHIPEGKRVDSLVQHVDVTPTILELLGAGANSLSESDGREFTRLLAQDTASEDFRPEIFVEEKFAERKFAIRTRKYKYIMANSYEEGFCRVCGRLHGGIEELYDLYEDPAECKNMAGERPDIPKDLRKRLLEWRRQMESRRTERAEVRSGIQRLRQAGKI
jgi:arylsulfatase